MFNDVTLYPPYTFTLHVFPSISWFLIFLFCHKKLIAFSHKCALTEVNTKYKPRVGNQYSIVLNIFVETLFFSWKYTHYRKALLVLGKMIFKALCVNICKEFAYFTEKVGGTSNIDKLSMNRKYCHGSG